MFTLHPRLAQDTWIIGDFPLSRLLLMNDATYPWCILVPRRADIREVFELEEQDQRQLAVESALLSKTLSTLFRADKMNIATLGNMVPQLHLHHIVRYQSDPAWPKPVWGLLPAKPYEETRRRDIFAKLTSSLNDFTPAEQPGQNG